MKRLKKKDHNLNTEWRLHPTKGWKKVWYGEKQYRHGLKLSWMKRIRDKFNFDIDKMKAVK